MEGTAIGAIAHVLLVIPALPPVIKDPNGSLGAFIVSIVVLAFAAGFIKPSLGPMLCDQSPVRFPVIATTKKGERVIVDPEATVGRYLLIFYWCINVGAIFAVATSYAERDIGFWLAYLLPGILYMLMPIVLFFAYKRLYVAPPQGSVLLEAYKVVKVLLSNGGWKKMFKGGDSFWNRAKPSYIAQRDGHIDTDKVFWDDRFVDEIKQSIQACQVFLLIPIFQLADGGFGNELNDMSSAMQLGSLPNDLINNWNSLAIIVATPIITWGLYPFMARIGWPLKPMTRMCIGFILGSLTCVVCAVIQSRVYATSPCGKMASTCDTPSSVSLWWQIPIYSLPAIGEIFVNVTSYELAYTRAPARMKGLVYALALFNSALASAIGLAVSNAITDPYLEWTWTALAVACALCAISFPTYFRHLNKPVEGFMNADRQAGLHQPKVLEAKANAFPANHVEDFDVKA
jgi:POT family proton-dependent oligopeptide transporter